MTRFERMAYAHLGYRAGESLALLTMREWVLGIQAFELRQRPEWERTARLMSAWSGEPLSAEDLVGPLSWRPPTEKVQQHTTQEDYDELKDDLWPPR